MINSADDEEHMLNAIF